MTGKPQILNDDTPTTHEWKETIQGINPNELTMKVFKNQMFIKRSAQPMKTIRTWLYKTNKRNLRNIFIYIYIVDYNLSSIILSLIMTTGNLKIHIHLFWEMTTLQIKLNNSKFKTTTMQLRPILQVYYKLYSKFATKCYLPKNLNKVQKYISSCAECHPAKYDINSPQIKCLRLPKKHFKLYISIYFKPIYNTH